VGSLVKFLDVLVAAIRWTPQYWREFGEYFGLLVSVPLFFFLLFVSPASCTVGATKIS
jgi:hypothetical protein